jgi:dGTPase
MAKEKPARRKRSGSGDAQSNDPSNFKRIAIEVHEHIKRRRTILSGFLVLPQPAKPSGYHEARQVNDIKASLDKLIESLDSQRISASTQAKACDNAALYVDEVDFVRREKGVYVPPGPKTEWAENFVSHSIKDYARVVHSASFRRLQGKTQLIPIGENEFFRTRLTHSLEVADIAVRIAKQINAEHPYFKRNPIDVDLVWTAGLCHDLGHPPFGHSGELELNQKMLPWGGFEGNAQTLRLIAKLENRIDEDGDIEAVYSKPYGLDLTMRTIASVLKYNKEIRYPRVRSAKKGATKASQRVKLQKGYYSEEADVIADLRARGLADDPSRLPTIECQIMDIADDIAYSSYDLEDTMVAGLVNPLDFISADDALLETIAAVINRRMGSGPIPRPDARPVTGQDVLMVLTSTFDEMLKFIGEYYRVKLMSHRTVYVGRTYAESIAYAGNPVVRRRFLEKRIERSIRAISVDLNEERPAFSRLNMELGRQLENECLKQFNYFKVILSPRLQIAEYRSREIISYLFDVLIQEPEKFVSDVRKPYFEVIRGDERGKARFVCDMIASMSDGEAVRLYDQLKTSNRNTIFGI